MFKFYIYLSFALKKVDACTFNMYISNFSGTLAFFVILSIDSDFWLIDNISFFLD